MEDWEEKKTSQSVSKQSIFKGILLPIIILLIPTFIALILVPGHSQKSISPTSKKDVSVSISDNTSVLNFEKLPIYRDGRQFSVVKRFSDDNSNRLLFFAFDQNKLYISSDFLSINDITQIEFRGRLEKVDVYFVTSKTPLIYDPNTTINDNDLSKSVIAGYYIFVQYHTATNKMLSCILIPNDISKKTNIHVNRFSKENPIQRSNSNIKPDNNSLNSRILFDTDIGKKEFCGLIYNASNQMIYALSNHAEKSLDFFTTDTRFVKHMELKHNFITNINITLLTSSMGIFDGESFTLVNIDNNEIKIISNDKICDYSPASIFSFIGESEDSVYAYEIHIASKTTLYNLEWSSSDNGFQVSKHNIVDFNQGKKSTLASIFNSLGTKSLDQDYIILNRCYYPWECYPNKLCEDGNIFYLGFFVCPSQNKHTGQNFVLFHDTVDSLFANVSGIDEPVDEAHVTYEDGKLTIYFMNKTSIFRWQNSEVGIGNLKLHKFGQ